MKTIKAHLQDLKEPHRTAALEAMDANSRDDEHPHLADALFCAFNWHEHISVVEDWVKIHTDLEEGTYFDAPQLTEESCVERKCVWLSTDADKQGMEELIKESNPKDSLGTKKVPLSGMPAPVLLECGLVKLHGDLKYGRYNWRDAGVRSSVYYDACIRHLMAWWEGEDEDPDSGVHHLAHAMTGLAVLRDSQLQGNCKDDRPKPYGNGWITAMNETAKNMIEKHENDK